jgi:peptide/nickel transport system substrate-binding protein
MIPELRSRISDSARRACMLLSVAVLSVLTGCQAPADVDIPLTLVPTDIPSPTELILPTETPPPKTLIVCLNREPESLFLYSETYMYGESHSEAAAVLEALYDGPWDVIDYQVEPVILEGIPDLIAGEDARLEEVVVREGDVYLSPESLNPEVLQVGKPYLPSGCQEPSCVEVYTGGEVNMQRLVATFRLKEGLVWSDGEPLTASDSVFSYRLESQPGFRTIKYLVDRTFSYAAEDERTTVWIGVPGFLDNDYALNFWTPLPQHILEGVAPEELLSNENATRSPLGWGPYRIVEWKAGQSILLEKNPNYFRAEEGLPHFERLLFRFIGGDVTSAAQQVLTQECDILHSSIPLHRDIAVLRELEEQGLLALSTSLSAELARFDFNVDPPAAVDFEPIFSDVRTRRALAQCIDREGILEVAYSGLGASPNSFLSTANPFYAPDLDPIVFDSAAASQALGQIGWVDEDGSPETPRVARGVSEVLPGTALSFSFLTTGGRVENLVAEKIQSDFANCGVEMRVEIVEPQTLNYPWPDGLVFGRKFEAAASVWPDWISPVCETFASWEIPDDGNTFGSNAGGFDSEEYDAACRTILYGPAGSERYLAAVQDAQAVFREMLPAVPLYFRPRLLANRPDACAVEVDPTSFSTLWNLEYYDYGENCTP